MSELVTRIWGDDADDVPAQHSGPYLAFIPDTIVGWRPELPYKTLQATAKASIALMRYQLDDDPAFAPDWVVSHAEGLASSTIEGIHSPLWRVAEAQVFDPQTPTVADDGQAAANVSITVEAVAMGAAGADLSVEFLCRMNEELMSRSDKAELCGRLRQSQNWIGGFSPARATYVPPPPEAVPTLMDDLVVFCNHSELDPIFTAALAHWQFETIHPFADGNGRTGRALIHYVLARHGLVGKTTVPISAILLRVKDRYISAIDTARHVGRPDSPQRLEGVVRWVDLLAETIIGACEYGDRLKVSTAGVWRMWNEALPDPTPAQARLMLMLGNVPVVDAHTVATNLNVDERTARRAIDRLLQRGILEQHGDGKRNRIFRAPALLQCIDAANSAWGA